MQKIFFLFPCCLELFHVFPNDIPSKRDDPLKQSRHLKTEGSGWMSNSIVGNRRLADFLCYRLQEVRSALLSD